ncbi:glycosyltransferase [Marinobacter sp. HL-58]|uniref:glycosyltransferase n=1 Tax=Marinobacter sp. HL-58 TaxID=1479237 RepID=UPI0004868139|nr:glycosyltransferase [Marinobacter sp. HL-58]KPP97784.1 MAG: GT4 family glycosyl transferase [Marinobacter sp. HL-58]
MKVLFITWDGPQVSYLEGLFLPIFRRLAEHGWEFHVLQFTWGDNQRLQRSHQACAEAGVSYRAIQVWRRPVSLGSLFTAIKGARDIRRAVRDWNIDVVMPRSTLPLLASMRALRGKQMPMVFDADGLPLDERVDFGGMSPTGVVYRLLRDVEAQGVRRSEVVLTRTSRAADILAARAGAGTSQERFFQVGNGRDASRFAPLDACKRPQIRALLGIEIDAVLLVYAGSLGEQYCLTEMLEIFSNILLWRPDARFLILTGVPEIGHLGVAAYAKLREKVIIRSVSPADVPNYLASADLGLALRRPMFSMQGVAPIKLGEYLLCGLPIIATRGIGDTGLINEDVGYLVDDHGSNSLIGAATWFTDRVLKDREGFRSRAREIGLQGHSLRASVDSYRQALERVSQSSLQEIRNPSG